MEETSTDIRTEFTDLLTQIEDEMRAVLAGHEGPAAPLYEMLAYHLGLDQPDGPRGKRMRPLLGLLVYRALTGDHAAALPGAAAVELGPQLQPGPRRHRGFRRRAAASAHPVGDLGRAAGHQRG